MSFAEENRGYLNAIYQFFSQKRVYHTLFWSLLLLILVANDLVFTDKSIPTAFGHGLIVVFIYALVVYMNLLYLIPNYLTKNEFWTYLGLLLLSILVITPIEALILYLIYSGNAEAQESVIINLNLYFIPPLLIASGSTLFKIINDWVRDLREKQELEKRTMQSELRFLKSQINPHFLFNTLNSLYALTLKKSDNAPEIVIKLSEMMRYMLYECNEKRVLLSKEVNYLHNYLALEKLRQPKEIDIKFEVEGNVSHQMIAPLMFIPFLENSFKHGLSNNLSDGFVHIYLNVKGEHVNLRIENSKPEKLPVRDPKRKSGGIGLVNVKRRLNLLYTEQYSLNIEDNPKSYAIELELKL
jgi:two-component system LytT family sensor kinase